MDGDVGMTCLLCVVFIPSLQRCCMQPSSLARQYGHLVLLSILLPILNNALPLTTIARSGRSLFALTFIITFFNLACRPRPCLACCFVLPHVAFTGCVYDSLEEGGIDCISELAVAVLMASSCCAVLSTPESSTTLSLSSLNRLTSLSAECQSTRSVATFIVEVCRDY
jgi:hypothetical protein